MGAAIDIFSNTDARGRGIFMKTTDSSAEWFAGVPYTGVGYTIGYDVSGGLSEYDSNSKVFVNTSGNVGVGDATPTYKLDVSGTGRFTGTVTVATPTSDSHAATKAYVDSKSAYNECYEICAKTLGVTCAAGYDEIIRWSGCPSGTSGQSSDIYYLTVYAPNGKNLYRRCDGLNGYYSAKIYNTDSTDSCNQTVTNGNYTIGICCR